MVLLVLFPPRPIWMPMNKEEMGQPLAERRGTERVGQLVILFALARLHLCQWACRSS